MSFIATDNIAYTNINSLHTQINPKEGSTEGASPPPTSAVKPTD